MSTRYIPKAIPKIDYTNDTQLHPDNRWQGADEAKAAVMAVTTLADGTQTRRVVAEEVYERCEVNGEPMTDAQFKDVVFKHAIELNQLRKGLSE